MSNNKAAKAVKEGVAAAHSALKDAHRAFGGEHGEAFEGNLKQDDGKYLLPDPIIDQREFDEIDELTKQYEEAVSPGKVAKAGKKIASVTPEPVVDF